MFNFIFFLIFFVILPLYFGYAIAKDRNRSGWKALIVIVFFGWIGVIALAILLKRRDPVTGFLQ